MSHRAKQHASKSSSKGVSDRPLEMDSDLTEPFAINNETMPPFGSSGDKQRHYGTSLPEDSDDQGRGDIRSLSDGHDQESKMSSSVEFDVMRNDASQIVNDENPHSLLKITPDDSDQLSDGSLKTSGEYEKVHPFTWRFFGLYYQYFAMGFYYGSMSPMMYPIFSYVLGMRSYQTKGALQVITMWWTFKMFIGALSDSFPIFGYRRKPYIIAGWAAAFVLTIVLITFGQPHPGDAPYPFIFMLSAITLTYLIGDVAMDSYLVDCAQREPVEIRGTLQSSIYLVRFSTTTVVSGLMAFGFTSKEYGGRMDWGFKLPQYLIILSVVSALGIYPYWKLEERPTNERKSYIGQFKQLFKRVELDAVWRVIAFSFLVHFFAYISNANAYDIERQWCHAEPWVDGLFGNVLSNFAVTVGIWYTKKYLLNVSWRKILGVTIIAMAFTTYIPALLVDFAVVRSQFFYLGAPLVHQIVYGIFFIVCTFCAVEIAEEGSEGIMYGLITTVGNLSIPFTSVCSSILAGAFDVYDADHKKLLDTPKARKEMAKLDTIIFFLQLLAFPMIYLLPPQKEAIRNLIRNDERHPRLSRFILISLVFCFFWSCTSNILLVFEKTACLRIVGGRGCKK